MAYSQNYFKRIPTRWIHFILYRLQRKKNFKLVTKPLLLKSSTVQTNDLDPMNIISVAYHIYLSTYIECRMNYGIKDSNNSNDMINNNTSKTQCMIIFNHSYDKLLWHLLYSNGKYRHVASICVGSLLKDAFINERVDKNCDNIFIGGYLICLTVLLLDRFLNI